MYINIYMDMLLAFLSITFLFFLLRSSSNVAVFEISVNNQCCNDARNSIGKRWVESVRAVLSVEMYQGIDGFVCLCFRQKYLRLFFVGGFLFLLYSTIMETIKGRSICNSKHAVVLVLVGVPPFPVVALTTYKSAVVGMAVFTGPRTDGIWSNDILSYRYPVRRRKKIQQRTMLVGKR